MASVMGSDLSFKWRLGHLGSFKWGVGNGERNLQEKSWACALSLEPPEPLAPTARDLAVPAPNHTAGPGDLTARACPQVCHSPRWKVSELVALPLNSPSPFQESLIGSSWLT